MDLTVVRLSDGAELDMGTPFDFFGAESAVDHPGLTDEQRANRRLLADAMQAHGFQPYAAEWWHYALEDEPETLPGAVSVSRLVGRRAPDRRGASSRSRQFRMSNRR